MNGPYNTMTLIWSHTKRKDPYWRSGCHAKVG